MPPAPAELTLEWAPRARYDVLDVAQRVRQTRGDLLGAYPRALYCSYHTTAGYLEQSLLARLQYNRQYVDPFIRLFQKVFPPEADYRHDQLHLRRELTPEQRELEPRNADSHLAFIGSGLRNCATYVHRGEAPVYFIDLDGVGPAGSRTRRTTVLAYHREEEVDRLELALPVSAHPVESINLRDPRLGLFAQLAEWLAGHDVEHGRLDLALQPEERQAGLTVNEYETLLMQHDLVEVLRDPLRFMAAKGRNLLRDPWAIPGKTLNYAKYDLVRVVNEAFDAFRVSESALERLVARCVGVPAARFFRLRRGVSFRLHQGEGVVLGTYQSPILMQWAKPEGGVRRLRASLVRFR